MEAMTTSSTSRRITALPTPYRGRMMRSRLEARWAMFFDAVLQDWEYEPGGIKSIVGSYLPDFKMPKWGPAFVEIKPEIIPMEEASRLVRTMDALALDGVTLYLIQGYPWQGEYGVWYTEDGTHLRCGVFGQCRRCNGLCIGTERWWINVGEHTCGDHDRQPLFDGAMVTHALEHAAHGKPMRENWTESTETSRPEPEYWRETR